jgi:hypothetical protein
LTLLVVLLGHLFGLVIGCIICESAFHLSRF